MSEAPPKPASIRIDDLSQSKAAATNGGSRLGKFAA
jgi:hypothetical protein